MARKQIIRFFLVIIVLLILFAAAMFAWLTYTDTSSTGLPLAAISDRPPEVFILQPAEATEILSGQGLVLGIFATSPAGVNRIDFLVDGKLQEQFNSTDASVQAEAAFFWFGSGVGAHRLSVIAYDRRNLASAEAALEVNVQPGGTLPNVAALESFAAEVVPSNGSEGEPNAAQGEAENPVAPQPADAAPLIDRFEVQADVNAQAVAATIIGSASDDVGLAQLKVEWRSDAGRAGDFTVDCGGDRVCSLESVIDLEPGPWLFALRAVDRSGQASPPQIESIEVVDQPGLPPAVADHVGIVDWLPDHNGADPGRFPVQPGFDLGDFLDGFFGGPEQAAGETVQSDGECLSLTIEPGVDGNQITMTVQCPLHVDGQDRIVFPHVEKSLANTGDGGISLFIPEWYDNRRAALSPGDSFTWLDWDVTCGTTYSYNGRVDEARVLDYARNVHASLGVGRNVAFASADAITPVCAPGAIADVDLRASAAAGGVHIEWDIAAGGDWPAELSDQGVRFILTRFDVASEDSLDLYHDVVPTDLLLAGGEFAVLDDGAQCENEYFYSLAAVSADADLNLISPGWLLRAQVRGPDLPCAAGDIGAIPLNLTPYWFNESNVRVRLQMQLPNGFAWPQGEGVELTIARMRQGENQWRTIKAIPITEEIRRSGLNYQDDDTSVMSGDYVYVYKVNVVVNRQVVQSGPNVSVDMPPAPPPPPDILRLTATNDCPAGAPRCVIVEWAPYQQPRANGYYAPAARIAVERIVGAIDSRLFAVDLGDTRFVDNGPYLREFDLADGTHVRVCRHDVLYRMVAFDAEGHTYGASPLSVLTPDCDARWNVVEEAR